MPSAVFILARMFSTPIWYVNSITPVVAEPAAEVGHLFVGDVVRIGGHRVGVGDGGTLVLGEER